MGRIGFERHVHFNYDPKFIEFWEDQSDTFKNQLEAWGEPYGYTGINIFYIMAWVWSVQHTSGRTFKPFVRTP